MHDEKIDLILHGRTVQGQNEEPLGHQQRSSGTVFRY